MSAKHATGATDPQEAAEFMITALSEVAGQYIGPVD